MPDKGKNACCISSPAGGLLPNGIISTDLAAPIGSRHMHNPYGSSSSVPLFTRMDLGFIRYCMQLHGAAFAAPQRGPTKGPAHAAYAAWAGLGWAGWLASWLGGWVGFANFCFLPASMERAVHTTDLVTLGPVFLAFRLFTLFWSLRYTSLPLYWYGTYYVWYL